MGKLPRRFGDEIGLHVRQLAWLHAAPRPDEPQPGFRPVSRLKNFKEAGVKPPLPPCPARHFVTWLMEAGPIAQTGEGRVALSWGDIDAWARMTRTRLRPWDARTLHSLSAVYLAELIEAESDDCPSPWWHDDGDFDGVDDRLEQMFDRLSR